MGGDSIQYIAESLLIRRKYDYDRFEHLYCLSDVKQSTISALVADGWLEEVPTSYEDKIDGHIRLSLKAIKAIPLDHNYSQRQEFLVAYNKYKEGSQHGCQTLDNSKLVSVSL